MPLTIVKCGEQLRQGRDWILDSAAKNTGMQIHLWTRHFDFHCGYSTQSVTQRWHPARDHSGIGDHCHVAFQPIAIFAEKGAEVPAADFLFTFNDEMQVHRQITILFDGFLNAENVCKDLTFVIRGTARKDVSVL